MSRSKKIPVLKDKPRNYKRTSDYWRPIRRVISQIVRNYKIKYDDSIYDLDDEFEDKFDLEIDVMDKNSIMLGTDIPNPKSIVNDWDYCDHYSDYRTDWITNNEDLNIMWKENRIKYSRK